MNHVIQKLPVLILNPYNRCNCHCVMCDIWKRDTVETLTHDRFTEQLAGMEALGVEWVVFSGGEPLMHAGLFTFCAELRRRKIRVGVLSSGLLLNRYASEIVTHVDDVIVSVDGPPEVHDAIRRVPRGFQTLASGVARIHELNPSFPIAARCTIQRRNCERLVETMECSRHVGLDSISFLAADIHSEAFNHLQTLPVVPDGASVALRAQDIPLLEAQVESLIQAGECGGFVLESAAKLRRIIRHFRAYLGLAEPVAPVCNAPWTSAVVEADGQVRPCFFHPPIGVLSKEMNLSAVINAHPAISFREGLYIAGNPVCRRCVCSLNWKSGL